ncbi:hypothetical protein ACJMK2_027990 [Sinanodonta woodiana]|uniref:EF-hand domain-containing protein n=1 Tax=Sinanodonta woodiana TaxID=1069815 RepID=A0ABD3X5N4_SINWO
MATAVSDLLLDTQGVQFTARTALPRTKDSARQSAHFGRSSSLGSPAEVGALSPNASLSSIEIEALLREKVRAKADSIKQAFLTYDADQNGSVTKGEFRRVLESFCFPMTTSQFEAVLAKVEKNSNGTVRYRDFFDKFYGQYPSPVPPSRGGMSGAQLQPTRFVPPTTAREINVDMIEKMLQEKMKTNLKSVIKALHLFDYNRDGKIQKHEMRRVIENYCFKLSDQQFDKLWQRYDFHHTGVVNYKDFLSRLGISIQNRAKPLEGAPAAMTWQQGKPTNSQLRTYQKKKEDEAYIQSLNFDQIEAEFRRRMKSNHMSLKKAFMSFDRNLDGFISIEDMKSILIQFTVPMSDQLFKQLMDRCGVKGTGKLSWEAFLERFQDPQATGNGQTLPIKPSHKFFPIREETETVNADDIWKLLYKHVHNHYSSMKQAFLQIDITRRGFVTRKELKSIVEKFTFHLSEEQFKQMMMKLDPYHTNKILYHDFLDLFEEKDSLEGHKWLNSVHRVNEQTKPVVMAWEMIEVLLREKITEFWKNVSNALMDYDYKGDGHISLTNLKKVIDNYVMPISSEHFMSMVNRCQDRQNGNVNYIEFLERLNVDVRPGDLKGLSSQIHDGSLQREIQRQEDQFHRHNRVLNVAAERTGDMSADEVITRLRDRIQQHSTKIRESFIMYDKRGKGLISKRDFRNVLVTFGMLMNDEQFNILVSKLNFHNGYMKYSDFIASFDDSNSYSLGEEIQRTGNHRVNPIRGDEYGMTVEQVEDRLKSKLRENFGNLRAAFYKFDENHTGALRKENFRRLLDTFMCVMSDEEFEKLCAKHGISKKTRITYPEFLERFEIRDTAEGHKWLKSVHRYNTAQPTPTISAEQAMALLKLKAHRNFRDIAQAFLRLDSSGVGLIRKKDLKSLLEIFVMPVHGEDFSELWSRFDEDGKGFVSHSDFLAKIGASEFTPGDLAGPSTEIIDQSRKHLEDHSEQQQAKQERLTLHQAQRAAFMTAEQVERILRDNIRDKYADFYTAFKKYDTQNKGSLSVNDVQKVLMDLNCYLDDEQFFRLLDIIGLPTNKSRLSFEDFLHAFEDGRKSSYARREKDVQIEEYSTLTPQEAEQKLRESVSVQVEVLERAFGAFDKSNTNQIPLMNFRRVLDLFCFKLSEAQWKHILSKLHVVGENVNYVLFLDTYTMSEQEDTERWIASLQKSLKDSMPYLRPVDEVHERLQETVSAKLYDLTNAFSEADYANLGVVSKEDFRNILNKHVFRLSDEQFEKVWSTLSVNEYGNLDYRTFLKRFSTVDENPGVLQAPTLQRSASNLVTKRPNTMGLGRRSLTRLDMTRPIFSRGQSRLSTPMVNAEFAENRVKDVIYKNWKQIQQQCRQQDLDNTGTISIVVFKEILNNYRVDLDSQEFMDLMTKYDLKENGTFAYVDFLRHFILDLKPQDDSRLNMLPRKRIHTPKLTRSAGDTSVAFYDAMFRLRDCVVASWKEMRRAFRVADPSGSGLVDAMEFRRVLRQFNVNLMEDEFFHLLSYYDKNMDGNISYNDFIRSYLNKS